MKETKTIVGVDVGTSSVKALAVTAQGVCCAKAKVLYGFQQVQPGFHEQDANELFEAIMTCISQIVDTLPQAHVISAISFSTPMHGIMGVNADGDCITPLIIWADTRSASIATHLSETIAVTALYERTGVPLHPMLPLCKIIWLRQHQPQLFRQIHKFIGIKEFIWWKLTGTYAVDVSIAAATGLFNIHQNNWDEIALELAGISPQQLAITVPVTFSSHAIINIWKTHWQLSDEAKLIIGSSDGCCANIGSGAIAPGDLALTIGTSAAVRVCTSSIILDAQQRTFCYPVIPGVYMCGGASNHGGNMVQWFTKNMMPGHYISDDELIEQALSIPTTDDGLICLPYILGERAPVWNPLATGVFSGLQWHHTHLHLFSALLKAVSFNCFQIAQCLPPNSTQCIYASGGFTQSKLWVQLIADIFNLPVCISTNDEASATGAAIIGWHAITGQSLLQLSKSFNSNSEPAFLPNYERHIIYQNKTTQMQLLYQKMVH